MTNKKALVRGINTLLPEETLERITTTCKTSGTTTTTERHNPNGKLSNWVEIALDKQMWGWHIHKLMHPNEPTPPRPNPERRQNTQQPNNDQDEDNNYHPPPPRHNNTDNRRHRHQNSNRSQHTNNQEPPDPTRNHERQDYNVNNVGHNRNDSLKALGLNLQATTSEIKHRFRRLSLIYHPDKYTESLPISKEEATFHFQLINNAYDFLRNNDHSTH